MPDKRRIALEGAPPLMAWEDENGDLVISDESGEETMAFGKGSPLYALVMRAYTTAKPDQMGQIMDLENKPGVTSAAMTKSGPIIEETDYQPSLSEFAMSRIKEHMASPKRGAKYADPTEPKKASEKKDEEEEE